MSKVSRRSVLTGVAGLGAAATVARVLPACDDEPAVLQPPQPQENRTLHFDLPPAFANGAIEVELVVGGRSYPITRHTAQSRTQFRQGNAFLSTVADQDLVGFVTDASFAAAAAQSYSVRYRNPKADPSDPRRGLLLAGINIPSAGLIEARKLKGDDLNLYSPLFAGQRGSHSDADVVALVDAHDCAEFTVYHHPELISLDHTTGALVKSVINSVGDAMAELVRFIQEKGDLQDLDSDYVGWANTEYSLDFEGNKIPLLDEDGKPVVDARGNVEYTFDFIPHAGVMARAALVIREALTRVRNDLTLEGRHYTIAPGFQSVENKATRPEAEGGLLGVTGLNAKFADEGVWRYGQRVIKRDVVDRLVTFTVQNSFFRHLGIWVAYRDIDGKIMKLSDLQLSKTNPRDTEYMRYLGLLEPPPRIFGIPVDGLMETEQSYDVDFPELADKLVVLTGTAGCHEWEVEDEFEGVHQIGMAMTAAFELGLPAFYLALGLGGQFVKDLSKQCAVVIGPQIVAAFIEYGLDKEYDATTRDFWPSTGLKIANIVSKKLIGTSVLLVKLLATQITKAAFQKALPVVGWVMFATDAVVTIAEILTTCIDIGLSRKCVESQMTATHKVRVTIKPDVRHPGAFPQTATQYTVTATRRKGATIASGVVTFDPVTAAAEVIYTFEEVPAGDYLTLHVQFLSSSGWIAGQGGAYVLNAVPKGGTVLEVSIVIEEQKVPLNALTRYSHLKKLVMGPSGARAWQATAAAPTITTTSSSCEPNLSALCAPGAITYSTMSGQVGYAFQAAGPLVPQCGTAGPSGAQLFHIQNVNDSKVIGGGAPDAVFKTMSCGATRPVHVCYELEGTEKGAHFALIPYGDYYYVYKIELTPEFSWNSLSGDPADAKNVYGRFSSTNIASLRYSRSGYLVAINTGFDKIELLTLDDKPAPQPLKAPLATLFAGRGSQRGLLNRGVAIACSYTGTGFLVLEGGNMRIQALDHAGNPLNEYFSYGGAKSCFAPLMPETNVTYLDISIEATDYIYTLSYKGSGASMNDYRLDIYTPEGVFLARTQGVAAAKLAVDFWRNVFTLNYETLLTTSGRTEPTISSWIPST